MKTPIIVEENTFVIVDSAKPSEGVILASKPQKGATQSWKDGVMIIVGRKTRRAKQADFEDYRISTGGYKTDPDFAFPTS